MDVPKHRSTRTTSLRDASDSSKMEGTGSWDAIEWTKIEPIPRFVSHANLDFLLESEQVAAEGHGVVLVNTDDAGTLMVTNFRLIFLNLGRFTSEKLGIVAGESKALSNPMLGSHASIVGLLSVIPYNWFLTASPLGPYGSNIPNSVLES
uniref:Myotubularin phosphatase domain-containing protein n=1 Tax=Cajanus cajan TaxID=3821 RepID=A0A151R6W7_CAJCA|nr:hypothetical protein KK1_040367 [Cajanus cajan]